MRIQEILQETTIDEGVNDQNIFKAVWMIGPMGAGKSTIARQLFGGTGLRSLNLDNFNELMIQKGQVPGGNLSPDQLEKSWQLTNKQKNNFVDGRLGLLIDGSGRNFATVGDAMEELIPLGYDMAMVFVNVTEETSIARQQSRATAQAAQYGVGRQVPVDLARSTYQQIQKQLPAYRLVFNTNFYYVDNNSTPDLANIKSGIDKFLRMPPHQKPALDWIAARDQGLAQKNQTLANRQMASQQRGAKLANRTFATPSGYSPRNPGPPSTMSPAQTAATPAPTAQT